MILLSLRINSRETVWHGAIMLFLFFPVLFGSPRSAHCQALIEQPASVQQELESKKARLQSIEKTIRKKQRKVRQVKKAETDVLAELAELDKQISAQWERLDRVKKQWTEAELKLERLEKQVKDGEKRLKDLKWLIESRLRILQRHGTIGTLNILMASDTLSDFLTRREYLKEILRYDQELRKRYIQELQELGRKQQELVAQEKEFKRLTEQLEKEAIALEERRKQKLAYLEELRGQRKKYLAMIRQLNRSKRKLKGIIDDLSARVASTEGFGYEPEDSSDKQFSFAAQRGKLNLPVAGPVVIFVRKRHAPGIGIEAPWGSEIRAIFDGKVLYSNELPGYGKVIIIDHGNRYFSLIAQGDKFFKDVGQEVAEGEVIGISGGGPWVPEGVYLEIRRGNRQQNPLRWFDLRGMEIIKR